ncbi:MAG: AAA family ATPase [Spirochaetaceae bacterium]|jgi:hypothetical protein|nr:AAA family ATPase [Spirochaetaceae bacterium]
MDNVNRIRDQIELAIEITRDSQVPVLLIANPGLAKSTVVVNWARRNRYHIETLIGSRFSQEEILGFQVRTEDRATGEQYLELLAPHWYRTIIAKEAGGVPSVLFLDELSTAQENVQGALLQLVFERTIGHGKKLPPSTLVIAAANYKQNIPWQFNMMAPILNRFCIVNLRYDNNDSFLNEFLQEDGDLLKDLPVYEKREIGESDRAVVRQSLKILFRTVFPAFEEIDNTDKTRFYTMDINNQVYNNIYEGNTRYVYNFITGRTVSYLYRITLSFLRKGLDETRSGTAMINMVYGLIGMGTNTFNDKQQQSYLKSIAALYLKLYAGLRGGPGAAEQTAVQTLLDFSDKEVADAIQEWVLFHESDIFASADDPNLAALIARIGAVYGTAAEDAAALRQKIIRDRAELYRFSNDMQRIDYLVSLLQDDESVSGSESRGETIGFLKNIKNAYEDCMSEALEMMTASLSG